MRGVLVYTVVVRTDSCFANEFSYKLTQKRYLMSLEPLNDFLLVMIPIPNSNDACLFVIRAAATPGTPAPGRSSACGTWSG
jgi:hypothetical protein